jgi:hypothetical protein
VQDILLELRYQLHLNGSYLFKAMKDTGDNIMVTCPMHKDGRESKPSCGVHKETGVVHCFTCGYSVQLSEMISNVFGYDDFGVFGKSWLRKNFSEIAVEERKDIAIDFSREKPSQQIEMTDEEYDKYRVYHPYMYKRGLTNEVIERFDIGYDAETDSIIFPCHNLDGSISYTIRRSVNGKRFHYQGGTQKSLYGIYEFYRGFSNHTELVVCESSFNALSCVVCGIPAIALNGTGSKQQIEQLRKLSVRSLVLALDPDEAGRKGTEKIAKALKNDKIIYTVDYKDSRDLNDLLLDGELQQLFCTKHLYNS